MQSSAFINQEIDQIIQNGKVEVIFNPSRYIMSSNFTISSRRFISKSVSIGEKEVLGINISDSNIPHQGSIDMDRGSNTYTNIVRGQSTCEKIRTPQEQGKKQNICIYYYIINIINLPKYSKRKHWQYIYRFVSLHSFIKDKPHQQPYIYSLPLPL